MAAFLDVQGAFDNVLPHDLWEKMIDTSVSDSVISFKKHLTFQRFIYIEFHLINPRYSSKGLPQGGVLSLLLYLIYVKNITKGVSKMVQVSQFADDIALYTNFMLFSKSRNLLEKGVEVIRINLLNPRLVLSLKKTKLVHFNSEKLLLETPRLWMVDTKSNQLALRDF